jgi:uncharacterized FlgJ-related protein
VRQVNDAENKEKTITCNKKYYHENFIILQEDSMVMCGVTIANAQQCWVCATIHKQYLKKFKPVSVELMQETGIPASVILGIAMLESGTGTSRNAKLLHNHFGIVGRNNLAQTKPGHRSVYKQYVSDVASYEHFVELLTSKKWFGQMKGNPEFSVWLKKMNHSGYSSAGHVWINRVTNIINRYKLYKLDASMDSVATESEKWLTVGAPPASDR